MSSAPSAAKLPAAKRSESPGQERRHHEARLQEDDREEQRVGPGAVGLDDLREVLVEVQEEVDEPVDEIHSLLLGRRREPPILSRKPGGPGPWPFAPLTARRRASLCTLGSSAPLSARVRRTADPSGPGRSESLG